MNSLRVVLITGISGSGKSVALRLLEDSGYTCVDNLPVRFLSEFIASVRDSTVKLVAVAIDARSPDEIDELPGVITALRAMGTSLRVVFLEADDETLIARYSESRRRHPLSDRIAAEGITASLEQCIAMERELLEDLRNQEHVIDTSGLSPGQLRAWVRDLVQADRTPLLITFESFAFKQGVPRDDKDLRPLTGRDKPVADWLASFDECGQMIDDIETFIRKWLPHYTEDTRSYLTVAIGCTGGQHRSVYVVESLARRFEGHEHTLVRHRNQVEVG